MKKILLWVLLFFTTSMSVFWYDISTSTLNSTTYDLNATYWSTLYESELSPDGTKLYILSYTNQKLYEVALSTPYDLSTLWTSTSVWLSSASPYFFNWASDWSVVYIGTNSSTTDRVYQYDCTVAWSLSTCSYSSIYKNLWSSSFWAAFIIWDAGNKMWTSPNSWWNLVEWNLSTPYDISTAVSWNTLATWTSEGYFDWSTDWLFLFLSNYGADAIKQYSCTTAWDITSCTDDTLSFSLWGIGNYIYDFKILETGQFVAFWSNWYSRLWDNVDWFWWPVDLVMTSSWTAVTIQWWVDIEDINITPDYSLYYRIYERDDFIVIDDWSLWSFSWWLNDVQILYDFTPLVEYDVELEFTNLTNSWNLLFQEYPVNYSYNSWPIDPLDQTFSYTTSWYTFFENWFTLNNFIPDPYWGELYLEIKWPALTGTWLINITTDSFLPQEIEWNWYWFDSQVKVTYPYHWVSWTYQVRVLYYYQDLVLYPFWTDYNSYVITVPEVAYSTDYEEAFLCDRDLSWSLDLPETVACPFITIEYYTGKVTIIMNRLKEFFIKLMSIWTEEVKTFWFINSVNANFMDWLPDISQQDNYLSKVYWFIKWFLLLVLLIMSASLIIFLKKR